MFKLLHAQSKPNYPMKKSLFLCLFLFVSLTNFATHILGGEVTYTHVSGLTYKINVKLYTQCGGAIQALPAALQLDISSVSQSYDSTITAYTILTDTIGNPCPLNPTMCSSPMSSYPGFKYKVYEGEITLPNAANDWVFFYSICCRTNNIVNITNSASQGFAIYAKLDNLNATGGFNNSVQHMFSFPMVMNTNQTYTYSQSAVDPDGDSLDFQFTSPIAGSTIANAQAIWAPGFSVAFPLSGMNLCTLNNQTGQFTVTPTVQGDYVFTMKTDEYRNGQLVGTTFKDINLKFMNGSNALPTLSGVNGTPNYVTSVNVCAGSSPLTFTINTADLDLADTVLVEMNNNNIPGSTLTSNNLAQPTVTFSWTPSVGDIRPQPYILTLMALDNKCPYNGTQSYAYLIYVNPCIVDSVWPGDANADYVVDNYDVLNIGLANNTSGASRAGATTSWTPQFCTNWANSFASTINYKHADCNGDGIINSTDLGAVTSNYGQTHLKNSIPGQYKTAGLPDLDFDTNGLIAHQGSTLQVPIMLGSSSSMMNNFYGISGHIKITNSLGAPITLNNTTSWLGNAANTILFQKNITSNDLAFTLVRNNQSAVNGQGQLATLSVPIANSASIGSQLILQFTDLKLITSAGEEILDYNVMSDTMIVQGPNAIGELQHTNFLSVYPNPIDQSLNFELSNTQAYFNVQLIDMFGKIILSQEHLQSPQRFDMTNFASGIYMLNVQTTNEFLQQKVIKR